MYSKITKEDLNTGREYQAPLEDMAFLLKDVFPTSKAETSCKYSDNLCCEKLLILDQAARFAEQELAPINAECDRQGCQLHNGQVRLPPKMKNALQTYSQAGWLGLSMPTQWGGLDQPQRLSACVGELLTSANHAFSMTPALSLSACKTLLNFGSDELKQSYLKRMISGQWTGTMCMTEAHCGSDLGLIRTSAVANDSGHYQIKGTKIFISSGAHDASENIIHLVLARIKASDNETSNSNPEGVKGLSLFLVPEKILDHKHSNSSYWNKNNNVHCIGIEEKMGVHANPTCTMSFENAQGFLIGEQNKGINAMFAMMNDMRLGTSLQGIGLSERSFQKSLRYAKNRTQMRSLKGVQNPELDADLIIVHPDVRRMLLTQKVFAEGGRALVQFCSQLVDDSSDDGLLDMLTPIAKGFCTEVGLESASHAIQIHGGHGFIKETGVEQLYRDGRIATLYEGTSGIQALDLLGRKVLSTQGKSLMSFTKMMHLLCKQNSHIEGDSNLGKQLASLQHYSKEWPEITMKIGAKAMANPDEVGAASFDYMMYSGYVVLAYFWVKMAITATNMLNNQQALQKPSPSPEFLENKIKHANFYFHRILPRALAHKSAMLAGKDSLDAHF